MHSRRHWRKLGPAGQLVFVLFVVPMWPEPCEEPFAVDAVVVIVVGSAAAVVIAAGLDQYLWLA